MGFICLTLPFLRFIATPLVTLIGILCAIYQYRRETIRKKRSETLALYIDLFSKTYNTREEYKNKTKDNLFHSEKIHNDPEFCKKY